MPPFDSNRSAPTKVAFRTVGCKLNQCETAQMQEALSASGYQLVGWHDPADVRVVNTCTVTAKSDRTCRHEIRLAKRLDPACVVVVTGCLAQVDPGAVSAIPGVDLVLGNVEKLQLGDHLARLDGRTGARVGNRTAARRAAGSLPGAAVTPRASSSPPLTSVTAYAGHPVFEREFISHFYGYTRAFLKVQTGCDSQCAYCVIPAARGPARSMPLTEVLEQVRLLAGRDYQEVVLTGINLGSWGRDTCEGDLGDLLRALMAGAGPTRIRLSSIEPVDVGAALLDTIDAMGESVAHHFHLPLQSGADSVLARMNRPYSAADYMAIVTAVARRFPDAAIGADVIVGFPGETEEEFEETHAFMKDSPLTYFHVFSYSDRPGTVAAVMRPKVPPDTIRERSLRLRELGVRKKAAFQERISGNRERALVLAERSHDGRLVGLTGNYQEVLIPGDESLVNRFVQVRLGETLADGRWEVTVLSGVGAG